VTILDDKVLNLPAQPGVYLFKDARGRVLYVGKAKRLSARVRSYLTGESSEPRLRELMAEAADVDVILTGSEAEALLLESTLIRQHKPHFNVLLKDDKSFPYVRVSVQEPVPRLSVTRNLRHDGARYLGPFTDVKRLRRTLREVRRIFPVRTCRNFEDYQRANRPCLSFHIHRCAGPCTTRSRATPEEYRGLIDGLLLFLRVVTRTLLRRLRAKWRKLDDSATARGPTPGSIAARKVRMPQNVITRGGRDADASGLARHGARAAVAVCSCAAAGRGEGSRLVTPAKPRERAASRSSSGALPADGRPAAGS
jgi:excinuclease ABC subunit C